MGVWEHTLGASDEWYTPAYIFDALGETFDLDVAAPPQGPLHVPCKYWISSFGCYAKWEGFVWMNPPFGGRNSIAPWLYQFFQHGNGIALTPDRTSAPWFQRNWKLADAVLFLPKVKFIRPDGSLGNQPGNGTALWAAGDRARSALIRAEQNGLGILALIEGKKAATRKPGGSGAASGSGLGNDIHSTSSVRTSERERI